MFFPSKQSPIDRGLLRASTRTPSQWRI